MYLSVTELAESLSISRQRVLIMVKTGQIPAQRIGRSWVINTKEVGRRPALGRPLSKRMAQVMDDVLSGRPTLEFTATERHYAVRYFDRLQNSENPAVLLHSWMTSRQIRVIEVSANPADLGDVARDPRIIPSGISDERAGLSSNREIEGYVSEHDVKQFVGDNLLVPSDTPNVRLHIVSELPPRPVPLGLVLADLADWNHPREDGRVLELLRGVIWKP